MSRAWIAICLCRCKRSIDNGEVPRLLQNVGQPRFRVGGKSHVPQSRLAAHVAGRVEAETSSSVLFLASFHTFPHIHVPLYPLYTSKMATTTPRNVFPKGIKPFAERKHPKTICMFDVDGTLSLARQSATPEMQAALKKLREYTAVAFVGGSDLVKIVEQLHVAGEEGKLARSISQRFELTV